MRQSVWIEPATMPTVDAVVELRAVLGPLLFTVGQHALIWEAPLVDRLTATAALGELVAFRLIAELVVAAPMDLAA